MQEHQAQFEIGFGGLRVEADGFLEEVVGSIVVGALHLTHALEEEAVVHLLHAVGQLRRGHTGLCWLPGDAGGQKYEEKEEAEECVSHDRILF